MYGTSDFINKSTALITTGSLTFRRQKWESLIRKDTQNPHGKQHVMFFNELQIASLC